MKIAIDRTANGPAHPEEGDIYIDEDGDVNIVIAAAQIDDLRNLKKEDLLVCCLKGDSAWIRGKANIQHLAPMIRLTSGDTVTITVE
jgi:hypothetical protein